MSENTPKRFRRIAVYAGSSDAVDPFYLELAAQTGRALAERGIAVVYGGGRVGLMGRLADAALEAGGEVYGVIPTKLEQLEVGHTGLTDLFVVDSMHARKAMMTHLADGFIALPGGFGTWEEILEVTTLGILNYHDKPVGLINANGYYDHLLAFIADATKAGFVREAHSDLFGVAETPGELIDRLGDKSMPHVRGWIGRAG